MKEAIWVLYGVIYFIGFKECTIENNGYNSTTKNGQFPGRHYGLIKYKCDDTHGFLVSSMACQKCWIYCPENELIDGCEQLIFPLFIGTFFGTLLTLFTILLWKCWLSGFFDTSINKIKDKRIKMKIKQHNRKVELIRAEIELHQVLSKPVGNRNIYPTLSTILFLITLFTISLACDNTLFITSTGMICDNNKCIKSEMYDLTIETGSIICFRDMNSDLLTIKMQSSYMVHKSTLLYYTSRFSIKTIAFWACKGRDHCWNGACYDGYIHPGLKVKDNGTLKAIKYGCDSDTLGCDTACFYQTSCTYYRLEVSPEGERFPIYKIISSLWAVDIEVSYKNVSKIYKLNVNNPRFDLDSLDVTTVPIMVTDLSYQIEYVEKYYITIEGKHYNIDAADINMPERDKIGDMQISTDKKSIAYNINDVKCRAISCKVVCSGQSPRLSRLTNNMGHYNHHAGYYMENPNFLVTKQQISGLAKIMIGNVNLNSLKVSLAKCHIDIIGSFSCLSCPIKSYIIVQASEIKEQGLLPFESNCSFVKPYLSCNHEPYSLELISQSKYCKIFIPSTNSSIIAKFDYNFLGKLDPSKELYSLSESYDNYSDLLKNRTVWETLGYSWLGFSLFSLILSLLFKNTARFFGFLTALIVTKKVEKDIEENNS